ncbi:MAG TPA: Chromate resistance protein ChrB [Trebonia sp.]|nr:Chromate resistance protein ChrB [Trebonia sp.]
MEQERESGGSADGPALWVLLCYRVPREPSAPRIAIWRTLKRLGTAQLGDGLVGLPADARTREQLEWVAGDVAEAGGSAGVWLARPATAAQERQLAAAMAAARAAEYAAVAARARAARGADDAERAAVLRRLRGELRRISRRDFFPPPEREQARAAVEALASPGRPDAAGAGAVHAAGAGGRP